MNRIKIILIIFLIIAIGIGGYILNEIDFIPQDNFDALLRKTINDNKGGHFNISNITPFAWDRLYIFPPYSDTTFIENNEHAAIGNADIIDADEGSCLLIFVLDNNIVYQLRFNRRYGDFFKQAFRKEGYSVEEAQFTVPNKDGYWLKIESLKR